MIEPKAFTDIAAARKFASAGNAIITLQSVKTGTHYTFQIQRSDSENPKYKADPCWFVRCLTDGSADEGTFTYIGLVDKNGQFRTTKASEHMKNSHPVLAFD